MDYCYGNLILLLHLLSLFFPKAGEVPLTLTTSPEMAVSSVRRLVGLSDSNKDSDKSVGPDGHDGHSGDRDGETRETNRTEGETARPSTHVDDECRGGRGCQAADVPRSRLGRENLPLPLPELSPPLSPSFPPLGPLPHPSLHLVTGPADDPSLPRRG